MPSMNTMTPLKFVGSVSDVALAADKPGKVPNNVAAAPGAGGLTKSAPFTNEVIVAVGVAGLTVCFKTAD